MVRSGMEANADRGGSIFWGKGGAVTAVMCECDGHYWAIVLFFFYFIKVDLYFSSKF